MRNSSLVSMSMPMSDVQGLQNQIGILKNILISCPKVFSQVLISKLQQINIASVSGHCVRIIFKICRTAVGTSKMLQFHEIF